MTPSPHRPRPRPRRLRLLVAFHSLPVAIVLVASMAATAAAGTSSLHRRLLSTFATPGVVPATSTVMVVTLPSGHVVFARNANLPLEPASNEKLAVTYTSLVELGASYRFPTKVLGEGRRVGDTWMGRLVLKGFGNPALSTGDLERLVNILWRLGIRHVTGGIVGDASYFDAKTTARGWLPSFAGTESPPLSALVVNRAARNGYLVANPPLAAAALFDRLLHDRGISARGASTGTAPPRAATVATIDSPPLSEILQFMDHESDNFTAEMILKAIGAKVTGHGTTVAGADVVKRDLRAAGVPLTGVRIVDGSGLSRDDRVTARELAAILVLIWNNPKMRAVVWSALPVAGENGTTLEDRLLDTPARGLVRAKTGTTDIASALSGYVGRRYAFVTIENGDPVNDTAAHEAEDEVAETLIDQVEAASPA